MFIYTGIGQSPPGLSLEHVFIYMDLKKKTQKTEPGIPALLIALAWTF